VRKIFYCKTCIRNGDFVHSSRYAERFAEKQLKWAHYKKEKMIKESLCAKKLIARSASTNVIGEIHSRKDRIWILQRLVHDKKEKIRKQREQVQRLLEVNEEKRKRLLRYEDRVAKLEGYVNSKRCELKTKAEELFQAHGKLKQVVKKNVQQLVYYIFPINVIRPSPPSHDHCDTISALADASRTTFIRDKWVLTDTSTELQYSIVAPTLPNSGDYSAYNDWVAANKDGVPGGSTEAVDNNQAYNISAALTYTTQLVNLLAFYLDVRLPSKLCYSEFCGNEMSEEKFAKRVARLNWNVLHLCLSQNVDPRLLTAKGTLSNILHLLNPDTADLGRVGACDINADAVLEFEEVLGPAIEANTSDEEIEDDIDNLPYEWESVPLTIREEESSSGIGSQSTSSQQQLSSTSVAGGLVTSAAASIASIWRGWATNR